MRSRLTQPLHRWVLLGIVGVAALLVAIGAVVMTEFGGRPRGPYATLYASYDNTPPGSTRIEYSRCAGFATVHCEAGGTGTYEDPITMATDPRELPIGTRVYSGQLRKYAVMEDSCAECIRDWSNHRHARFDFYAGTTSNEAVLRCEDSLTSNGRPMAINPPPGKPVDPSPIFDDRTGVCWHP